MQAIHLIMNDDQQLLELLKLDDSIAFERLFEKYASRLYRFSLHLFNGNVYDAEEVVQDVFLKIWENRAKIDTVQNFNSYVITIAKHQVYDRIKHKFVAQKYRKHILHFSAKSISEEDQYMLKNMVALMRSCVALMPEQQRGIILLRNRGYTNAEIAQKLNLSVRTIETHVSNALKFLRNYFLKNREITILFSGLFV